MNKRFVSAWKNRIPFIALCIFFATASAYLFRPPWFDEVLTLLWLKFPLSEIPFQYKIPNNHIVYTMTLSVWKSLLEPLDLFQLIPMRFLSVLTGGAVVWILSKDLIRFCGFYAGGACALLFASSSTVAIFSTAFRGYILALLLCFLAFRFACRWGVRGRNRDLCLTLLFMFLGVGVMPSNLFLLESAAVLLIPNLWKARDREGFRFRFLTLFFAPPVLLLIFYLPILPLLWNASRLLEGWHSYAAAYANLYGAFVWMVLPVMIFAVFGTVSLWKRMPRFRWTILCALALFLLPAGLAVLTRVPPFPRIFFPLFGIWMILLAFPLGYWFRRDGKNRRIPVLVLTLFWLLAAPFFRDGVSCLYGGHHRDDLILPAYATDAFQPHTTAKKIAEMLPSDGMIFVDFDADPPSLTFQLPGRGVPEYRVLYDRPGLPKPDELEESDLIVCTGPDRLAALKKRFRLSGEYECILDGVSQKIYRRK